MNASRRKEAYDPTLPATVPQGRMRRASPSTTPPTGRVVAETYRIERLLGRGGMAEVVLARDLILDRHVAIKFLASELLEDPAWRERFVTEARSMAALSHPNLVQIHTFGVHDGCPYFVMEYVEGQTLSSWAASMAGPELEEITFVVRQIARGLDAVHAAGLVHHDVKPANVLLSSGGRVVLTDFGLSRLARLALPTAGGTPRYMAPEQASGSVRPDLAARVDVYQLAVTAFELIVGAPPFDDEDPEAVLHLHRTARIPRPSAIRPDLHRALDAPIFRALAKDPKERTPSVLAFSNELDRALRQAERRPLRVLVADDDASTLRATSALLSAALPPGSHVESVPDGSRALAAASSGRFDVLVLDVHMPGATGIDIARALRDTRPRPRIVAMTGDGGAPDWRELRELGAEAMLLKPFDADELIRLVEHGKQRRPPQR